MERYRFWLEIPLVEKGGARCQDKQLEELMEIT
jgi:hypothetical protein